MKVALYFLIFFDEFVMGILRLPSRAYDYVYGCYGWFGVAFAGVALVVLVVCIMIWFDRRK